MAAPKKLLTAARMHGSDAAGQPPPSLDLARPYPTRDVIGPALLHKISRSSKTGSHSFKSARGFHGSSLLPRNKSSVTTPELDGPIPREGTHSKSDFPKLRNHLATFEQALLVNLMIATVQIATAAKACNSLGQDFAPFVFFVAHQNRPVFTFPVTAHGAGPVRAPARRRPG